MLSDLTPPEDQNSGPAPAQPIHYSSQPAQGLLVILLMVSTLAAGFLMVSYFQTSGDNQRLALENQSLKKELSEANESAQLAPASQADTSARERSSSEEPSQSPAEEAEKQQAASPPSNPVGKAAQATYQEPSYGLPGFEATNLQVQQAVVVELDDGRLQKVLVEIPVLYQSRELRMNAELVRELRQIREQVVNHQSKLMNLRSEGALLLAQWNQFLRKTTPAPALRADSVTLPSNQGNQAPNRFAKPLKKADITASKTP